MSHLSPGYEAGRRDITYSVFMVALLDPAVDTAVTDSAYCQTTFNAITFTEKITLITTTKHCIFNNKWKQTNASNCVHTAKKSLNVRSSNVC
jgi:hypothetical protein